MRAEAIESRLRAIIREAEQGLADIEGSVPPWYRIAQAEIGVREIPGSNHESRVLEYLTICDKTMGGNLGKWGMGRDETAWCAAFVGWCLLQSGAPATRSARARSYEDFGAASMLRRGAIVVLSREGGGHVGFVDDWTENTVAVLGGNQRNSVNVANYPRGRILAVRWPYDWMAA